MEKSIFADRWLLHSGPATFCTMKDFYYNEVDRNFGASRRNFGNSGYGRPYPELANYVPGMCSHIIVHLLSMSYAFQLIV
jgi:hypothetical protein